MEEIDERRTGGGWVSLFDLLSQRGMTVLDRAEAEPAEAASVRPVLDPRHRAELRGALEATFVAAQEFFGSGRRAVASEQEEISR